MPTRLFGDGPAARVVITDPPHGCKIAGLVSGNGAVKHQDFVDGSGGMASEELEALLSAAHDNAVRHLADGGLVFSFMDYRELGGRDGSSEWPANGRASLPTENSTPVICC